ncbi:biotin transporter BioY [Phyllobacterium sp. SB3]|uniref:biotin transporter BioY n=1 Tax=Phyllobacterium sp. SB3 TaxID=3156073 RepID=UPI0032AFB9DB
MAHIPEGSILENSVIPSRRTVLTVIAGAALMTLAAKTQIPFWPVPMTLHTLAVMAFAVVFGPRIAASIFIAYLAAGATGLPVFSGSPERGIGLAYMVGPTGGYLLGYLVASWLVGVMAYGKGALGRIGAMLTGLTLIYALGITWLAVYVPFGKLLTTGVFPFLLGDLMKIGVVALGATLMGASFKRFREKRQ